MENKEWKDLITFRNRYFGNEVFMVHVDGPLYKLYTNGCNYVSLHYNDDKSIFGVDPEGGPFLHIGYLADETHMIKEIVWDDVCNCYLITLD